MRERLTGVENKTWWVTKHLLCVEAINVQYSHLFDYRAFPGFTGPWKQKNRVFIKGCVIDYYPEGLGEVVTLQIKNPHDAIGNINIAEDETSGPQNFLHI